MFLDEEIVFNRPDVTSGRYNFCSVVRVPLVAAPFRVRLLSLSFLFSVRKSGKKIEDLGRSCEAKKMKQKILQIIDECLEVKKKSKLLVDVIEKITREIIKCYRNDRKVVIFGNGGSASDAQHIVTELVSRFEKERKSLSAISLTTNTSTLTAIANDYSFDKIFSRQVESTVIKGDIVIAISTSGNSKNVIEGAKQSKKQGAIVVGFTGSNGGKLKSVCDIILEVPSNVTARIQEVHITVGHIICKLVEDEIF
ncbi:MAG: SIS domain-containing protein [Elusimicrobiota bacterium]